MTMQCSPQLENMVLQLFRDPSVLEAVRTNPDSYFEGLGLSVDEQQALREATFSSLDRIGLHPMLRMHYMLAVNPGLAEHVTVKHYLPQLTLEPEHG